MGDEDFYQAALQELDNGNSDQALLAKAWVNANGDESRRKIEYVKLRVAQLKADRIRRTAAAAGSAAKSLAPGFFSLLAFVAKIAALMVIAVLGVAALSHVADEREPGRILGSVLAGVLVIYLISKLIEWALIKRIVANHTIVVALSTVVSFLLILVIWYSGMDKPYALHPDHISNFFLASILLLLARALLPGRK